jgi:hypothetical protein
MSTGSQSKTYAHKIGKTYLPLVRFFYLTVAETLTPEGQINLDSARNRLGLRSYFKGR